MLSSFQRFASHVDEQRLDQNEGKTFLVHRTQENGGQTLLVEMDFGHDAYVLCGSLLPSVDLMHAFGATSGIVIMDPAGFAASIAEVLPGFHRGVDGPCSYQLRRIIEHDFGWLDLGPAEEMEDISKFKADVLQKTIDNMVKEHVYFLKYASYVAQAEWRFVWLVDHAANQNIVVEAPAARKFCVRWESQGDVVAFGGGRV